MASHVPTLGAAMPMKVETMNQRVPLLLQEIDGNKISAAIMTILVVFVRCLGFAQFYVFISLSWAQLG